jgi:hypothetical protein
MPVDLHEIAIAEADKWLGMGDKMRAQGWDEAELEASIRNNVQFHINSTITSLVAAQVGIEVAKRTSTLIKKCIADYLESEELTFPDPSERVKQAIEDKIEEIDDNESSLADNFIHAHDAIFRAANSGHKAGDICLALKISPWTFRRRLAEATQRAERARERYESFFAPLESLDSIVSAEDSELDRLSLGYRARSLLDAGGYKTIGSIRAASKDELLNIVGFGKICLRETLDAIDEFDRLPFAKMLTSQQGTSARQLELTVRAERCLRDGGYKTVESIDAASDEELLRVEGLGNNSLKEIRAEVVRLKAETASL